jgi:ABC-type amino acid transport substrate-binding protein
VATRLRCARAALLFVVALAAGLPAASADEVFDKVKASGTLKVAVYRELYPFSEEPRDGKAHGIDVDIAQALADKLGLRLALLPFGAGEDMGDDFRNMVWKGHYLGYGPADVMLHVPVDKVLQDKNEQVAIIAPYYRENLRVVRNVEKVPTWNGIDSLRGLPVAVDGESISSQILLSAEGGVYGKNLMNTRGIDDALKAFKSGDVVAVMAMRSEIEAGLGRDPKFEAVDVLLPAVPRNGWVVGAAVKAEASDLAREVKAAIITLRSDGTLKKILERYGVSERSIE